MTWVRHDDTMPENDKVYDLSDVAFRLSIEGKCRSSRKGQDGWLAEADVAYLTRRWPKPVGRRAVRDLVTRRLWHDLTEWHERPCASCLHWREVKEVKEAVPATGYLIHDYLEYNPAAWEVEVRREQRRVAGRIGGVRSGQAKRDAKHTASDTLSDSLSTALHNRSSDTLDGTLSGSGTPYPRTPFPVPQSVSSRPRSNGGGADRSRDQTRTRGGLRAIGSVIEGAEAPKLDLVAMVSGDGR